MNFILVLAAISWQDYAAWSAAGLCAVFLAWQVWRVLRAPKSGGCGSGCSSCESKSKPVDLVEIGALTEERPQSSSARRTP